MPSSYFNYIEYHSDFIRHAYDDPLLLLKNHIFGLLEIQWDYQKLKNKALKEGVQVSMKMPLLMIKVLSSLLVLHQLMKNQLEYNNNYNKKKKRRQTDHCSLWFFF